MNIAVCDDNEMCRKILAMLLDSYSKQNPQYEIIFSVYEHADDLLTAAKKTGGFDIYILDILMPDTNGVELGVLLRETDHIGKIIYLTSSEEFVFDAFKAQPFNYILKPVEKERLFSVLDAAIDDIICKMEKSIIVKTTDGNVKLSVDNIMYAELINRAVFYYLANGRIVESTTIRTSFSNAVKELIENNSFVLCGSSFIVNLLHITAFNSSELIFRNSSTMNLPKKHLTLLRTKWYEYWKNEHGEHL